MDKWSTALIIFGVLGLALIAIQPIQLSRQNEIIDNKLTEFVQAWEDRVKISNKVNNSTQLKVENTAVDILNNLSAHRHVTNATFDKVQENEKVLIEFIKKFNNTNEVERGKAVDKILHSIEEIKNILNKTS
jgi:uncharacterized protein YpuA (DUF1002 family)